MGPAGDVHIPAHGEAHQIRRLEITVRAGLTEGSDGTVHQAGRVRRQAVVSQAPGIHVSRGAGFQQHVGSEREPAQQRRPFRCSYVQGHAALVGVEVEPVQAAAGAGLAADEGANLAHGVAAGRLDFDDVGTHVGQQLAAINAHGAGQVQYPVTAEGAEWSGAGLFSRDGHLGSIQQRR